jgi:hypothetical protein
MAEHGYADPGECVDERQERRMSAATGRGRELM